MQCEFQSESTQETQFFPQKPASRLLIIGFLFIAALGIRLYHIDKLDANPIREYRSALIARGYYFEGMEAIPEWRKQVAHINRQAMQIWEPPFMELLTSFSYRIMGGEYLWIPRLFSSLFWLIGGVFLYLLAKKIVSADGAMFSTAFYLFLPSAAFMSRSFTPDPLMIMTVLVSIFTISQYYDKPTLFRLLLAATISALSMFIKPFGLFPILGAFVSLAIWRQGFRKQAIDVHLLAFIIVSVLPCIIYYGHSVLPGGNLSGAAQGLFMPHIILHPIFWAGWLYQIHLVVGFPALAGGLLGVLLLKWGQLKALLIGLWSGYFVFCLVFNGSTYSHDNYHLMLVPIVALSIGPVCILIANQLKQKLMWPAAGLGIFLPCILLAIISIGIIICKPHIAYYARLENEIRIAEKIRHHVGHNAKSIFLAYANGELLQYHGELVGLNWLYSQDLHIYYKHRGLRKVDVEERFNNYCSRLGDSPDYFIVADLREFWKQPDLRKFLTNNFPIAFQDYDYMAFDLRKKVNLDSSKN